jgi:hypothetical protein
VLHLLGRRRELVLGGERQDGTLDMRDQVVQTHCFAAGLWHVVAIDQLRQNGPFDAGRPFDDVGM